MINLDISDSFASLVDPTLLERTAQTALDQQQAPADADLTVVITGDDQIQTLNRQFLGEDAPTDVLSFPADYLDPETNRPYLGDILISFPQVLAQAATGGHSVEAELQLLTVHGVLHLLGHDHLNEQDKIRMWADQSAILNRLRNPLRPP